MLSHIIWPKHYPTSTTVIQFREFEKYSFSFSKKYVLKTNWIRFETRKMTNVSISGNPVTKAERQKTKLRIYISSFSILPTNLQKSAKSLCGNSQKFFRQIRKIFVTFRCSHRAIIHRQKSFKFPLKTFMISHTGVKWVVQMKFPYLIKVKTNAQLC